MKRFWIYLFAFPAVATVSFYAVIYILTGAEVDSVSLPAQMAAMLMIPALVIACLDWLFAKSPIPAAIATPFFIYVATVLFLFWEGSARFIFVLGLIPAIPTAVASWLSNRRSADEDRAQISQVA